MKNRKLFCIILLMVLLCMILSGCTEANKATRQVQIRADSFNVARRIIVINTRTDSVLYEIISTSSLSNSNNGELQITSLVGENKYKLDYVYLNSNISYIVQDVSDIYTDPYHYEFNILPKWGRIEQES